MNCIMVGYTLLDMASKKKTESRHGKLAPTTAQTSITMQKDLLAKARAEADKEGRSLSNWLEQLVKRSLIVALLAGASWQFLPDSRPVLRSAGKALASFAESAAAQVAKL